MAARGVTQTEVRRRAEDCCSGQQHSKSRVRADSLSLAPRRDVFEGPTNPVTDVLSPRTVTGIDSEESKEAAADGGAGQ